MCTPGKSQYVQQKIGLKPGKTRQPVAVRYFPSTLAHKYLIENTSNNFGKDTKFITKSIFGSIRQLGFQCK